MQIHLHTFQSVLLCCICNFLIRVSTKIKGLKKGPAQHFLTFMLLLMSHLTFVFLFVGMFAFLFYGLWKKLLNKEHIYAL